MKTSSSKHGKKLQFKTECYLSHYLEQLRKLEKWLSKKPKIVIIEIIGAGEIPADWALLIRQAIAGRSPKTRIITQARSSLHGGSVLVWLSGESRTISDDALVFFRKADLPDDAEVSPDEKTFDANYRDSCSAIDPDEGDYARMLQYVNEYLPVKELAGRLIGVPVLRQFGLLENERMDKFLAAAFSKNIERDEDSENVINQRRALKCKKTRTRRIQK